jgi:heme-degrading monooxygenase HmoA
LNGVPGFTSLNLLRVKLVNGITLLNSHSVWKSRTAFEDWNHSEVFRKAHAGGAEKTSEGAKTMSAGPPKLELFVKRPCNG